MQLEGIMKSEPREHFEVFVDSIYGSDIIDTGDTFEEALRIANAWAKDIKKTNKVVVIRVTEQVAFEMNGRKEK